MIARKLTTLQALYRAIVRFYRTRFSRVLTAFPSIYAPEVNSLRARHKGGAVQSMALWGGCFLVVMVTPPGVANLSWSVMGGTE